jgi:hypothetical protein
LSDERLHSDYASQWFGSELNQSIRFELLRSNRTEPKAQEPNHWNFDSVRFLSIWNRPESTQRQYKKWLLISSLRRGVYIYIYICMSCTQHARAMKKIFFAKIIELNRSFSKLFECCKSDENWAQLLALKLYVNVEAIRNSIFWCSWCSR